MNSQIRIIKILPMQYSALVETKDEEGNEFIGGVIDASGRLTDAQKAELLALLDTRETEIAAAIAAEYQTENERRTAIFKAKISINDVIDLAQKYANTK